MTTEQCYGCRGREKRKKNSIVVIEKDAGALKSVLVFHKCLSIQSIILPPLSLPLYYNL